MSFPAPVPSDHGVLLACFLKIIFLTISKQIWNKKGAVIPPPPLYKPLKERKKGERKRLFSKIQEIQHKEQFINNHISAILYQAPASDYDGFDTR